MFAKACWESIKAAYTSASITDGMDLYRDLNKVFYDPSLGVAELWIKWISYGANSLLPLSHLPIKLEERVLIDARVLGMPQSCDTALFNNNGISNHNRGFNGISSQHRINNNSTYSNYQNQDTERDMAFMAIANSDDLISDSGATAHMTCRKEWLFDYTPISHYSVSTATKEPHIVEGKGTLKLLSYHDGKAVPISITNVLYVPNYAVNLISECCLEEKGCTIESSKDGRIIYDKYGNVAFIANRHNKLNKLNCK
ncbi:hypothetical protein BASA60_002803 [Batrachochytrium salamandrivorans]|nr:hypothetical protein BASA60_002803 [Batrachochytrium salamandrivorans]